MNHDRIADKLAEDLMADVGDVEVIEPIGPGVSKERKTRRVKSAREDYAVTAKNMGVALVKYVGPLMMDLEYEVDVSGDPKAIKNVEILRDMYEKIIRQVYFVERLGK